MGVTCHQGFLACSRSCSVNTAKGKCPGPGSLETRMRSSLAPCPPRDLGRGPSPLCRLFPRCSKVASFQMAVLISAHVTRPHGGSDPLSKVVVSQPRSHRPDLFPSQHSAPSEPLPAVPGTPRASRKRGLLVLLPAGSPCLEASGCSRKAVSVGESPVKGGGCVSFRLWSRKLLRGERPHRQAPGLRTPPAQG